MSESIKIAELDGTVTDKKAKKKEKLCPVLDSIKRHISGLSLARIASSIEEKISSGTMVFDEETPLCSTAITADDVKVDEITTWRISQRSFVCDLAVIVPLETQPGLTKEFSFQCSVGMSLDRWGEYEMSEVTPYSGIFPEHPGVKLDSFGLPLFNKEDIPGASVAIWDEWHQAALTEAVQRQPLILAEEMELRVERRKLHGCPDQPYILFFESDTVLIDREKKVGARKAPPPYEETFDGATIVINENFPQKDGGDLSIYMACFQYHWHYIFYWIQGKRTTDKRSFKMKKMKAEGMEIKKNPLHFLWSQLGGMELMLPRHILEEKVRLDMPKALQKKPDPGYILHQGFACQNLATMIAAEYNLKPFRVKQRLNEIGMVAARGTLNWEPEMKSYVAAFAVSDCYNPKSKDETFFINRWKLEKLYQENEELRKTLMTGNFVHVNGLVCWNDPAFVTVAYSGTQKVPRLTAWANAHVDECCLLFKKSYPEEEYYAVYDYLPEWNDARLEQCIYLRLKKTKKDLEEEKKNFLTGMPSGFSKALEYLMLNNPQRRLNALSLAEQSGISDVSILLRGKNIVPSFYDLINLCIGMSLPSWISVPFIHSVGIEIEREGILGIWGQLLDCYPLLSVKDAQKYVNLHSRTQQEERNTNGGRAVLFIRQPKGA